MIRARTHLRYGGYSAVCGRTNGRKKRGILGVNCDDCAGTAVFWRLLDYQRSVSLRADVAVALDWLADHLLVDRRGDYFLEGPLGRGIDALLVSLWKRDVLIERRRDVLRLKPHIGIAAEQAALLAIETDTAQYGQEWIMSTLPGERQRGACVVGLLYAMLRLMARRRLESRESTSLLLGQPHL